MEFEKMDSEGIDAVRAVATAPYRGAEADPYLPYLKLLRMRCLIDYPYLRVSSYAEEHAESCPTTRLCVARTDGRVVGLAMGMALEDYTPTRGGFHAREKLTHALKGKVADYFIVSDVYVEPEFRHEGIGRQLLHELVELVAAEKQYAFCCVLNLERDGESTLFNENPYDLSVLWDACKFTQTTVTVIWPWKIRVVDAYGEHLEECNNILRVWSRPLKR